jgi:type 1 glutamine amidotransferase
MTDSVFVSALGHQAHRLREAASRISGQSKSDWWAEKLPTGTTFCFDNDKARTLFCAYCADAGIRFTARQPGA